MQEVWKPVNYRNIKPGMYEVSNLGRIRNTYTKHILVLCPSEKGYMMAPFRCSDDRTRSVKIHRIVAESFVSGKSYERNEVNHKDGDKQNNRSENLEWCSRTENIRHGFESGLIPSLRGSLNGMAVIDETTAELACRYLRLYCGNVAMVQRKLRHEGININRSTIYDIKRKRTWAFISDKYFTHDFIFGITKLDKIVVNLICEVFNRNNGNLEETQKFLKSVNVEVPDEYIMAIANKIYWIRISNKHFKNKYKQCV